MTNDTNTLNGALQELGETMADNLTTMGVPSTYDEGLTTLAGKILQIAPVPPTPSYDNISDPILSDGKQILSYADVSGGDEYATLQVQLLDGQSSASVSDIPIAFYKYVDGVNDVLLDTVDTDASGQAEYTYNSAGIGDVSIYATADNRSLVSEIYELHDDLFYDSMINSVKNNWQIDSGTTVSSDSTGTTFSYNGGIRYIKLPVSESSFVMEWDHINGSGVNKLGAETWNGTTWVSYCVHESGSNQYKIYGNSSSAYNSSFIENCHCKYVIDGNSHSFYVDGHLVGTQTKKSATGTFYIGFYVSTSTQSQKIKNVEIKPL